MRVKRKLWLRLLVLTAMFAAVYCAALPPSNAAKAVVIMYIVSVVFVVWTQDRDVA